MISLNSLPTQDLFTLVVICEIEQVGRILNGDAHDLAKLAAQSGEVNVWLPPRPGEGRI
jgi:hypothetical protein